MALAIGGLVLGAVPASATINDSPGYVHLMVLASRKCVDVGPPVEQWRCLNTFNEEFQLSLTSNGGYLLINHASGLCLAQADSSANGTPVVQEPCNQQDYAQKWDWFLLGYQRSIGYYYQLVNESFSQCLDLENGNQSDGVPMQVWDCNPNTANQAWQQW
jgi:hypothetical protein